MKQFVTGKTAARVLAAVLIVAVVALGGFYYTQHQACRQEAEFLREQWTRLGDEVLTRRVAVSRQFATSPSVAALLELEEPTVRNPQSPHAELRDRTLPEVEALFAYVSEYVDAHEMFETANRLSPVQTTAEISTPANIMDMTDEQLIRMQPAMSQVADYMAALLSVKNASEVLADCSPSNVLARLTGEVPYVVRVSVRAHPSPAAK